MNREWIEAKNALKKEICNYFFKAGKNVEEVKAACLYIKEWGEIHADMQIAGYSEPTEIATKEDGYIVENFPSEDRENIAQWINRYAQLSLQNHQYLESQRYWKDKSNKERPNGEIQVCSDRVRVIQFDYTEDFAALLPADKQQIVGEISEIYYIGYEWAYPVNNLKELEQLTKFPVLYAIDVQVPILIK